MMVALTSLKDISHWIQVYRISAAVGCMLGYGAEARDGGGEASLKNYNIMMYISTD
jgi:hypothetical protein